jgi:hypothetical protein
MSETYDAITSELLDTLLPYQKAIVLGAIHKKSYFNKLEDKCCELQTERDAAFELYNAAVIGTRLIDKDLKEAEEQRDRLVEILASIIPIFNFKYLSHEEKQKVRYASEALAAMKENQTTNSQSCPECDALASHGSNDGPCDVHKL